MPTPSEQKALAFIAFVALLGGAVRIVRASSADEPTPAEQQAVARQSTAAESASTKSRAKTNRRVKVKRDHADSAPNVIAGVASVQPNFARPDQPFSTSPYGFPPPGPRIDLDRRGGETRSAVATAAAKIDMDRASATEIEALPRIGPAMAKKIVADREAMGPFRTLDGLRRVKGIGPATLKLIADRVTFSGK